MNVSAFTSSNVFVFCIQSRNLILEVMYFYNKIFLDNNLGSINKHLSNMKIIIKDICSFNQINYSFVQKQDLMSWFV